MDRPQPSQLRLLSDRPVTTRATGDLLDRSREAERLAALLHDSRESAPYVFAVYADWGMGKTSLLRLTGERLGETGDIEVVWFNAWLATDGRALEMIVKSVLDRLDPNSLRRLARKLSADSAKTSWTRVLLRGLAGSVRMHHLVDGIWDHLAVDARTRADAESLFRSAVADYTGADGSGSRERTIVVFIDDLDRCSAETIRELSAALKQYLAVPGLVFVLGCDRSVVEGAMRFGPALQSADEVSGRRYLEKIIQASYAVPAPTDAQLDKLIAGYADAAGAASLFDGTMVEAVKLHTGRNPRRVKQLMNRLVAEYRLDPDWQSLGAEALFSTAMLQELYPDFHRMLAMSEDMDPLEEFTGYLAVVATVKAAEAGSAGVTDDQLRRALECLERNEIHVAEPPEISKADLTALESVVPESIPKLAHDKVFAGLVKALVGTTAERELRAKLRRRKLAERTVQPVELLENEYMRPETQDFRGLSVLWLGQTGNEDAVERMSRGGAAVYGVPNLDRARNYIQHQGINVLITDLARDDSREGGFDDIAMLSGIGFSGQVIIYTGYITQAWRDRADAMDALITSDPEELLEFVARARPARRTATVQPEPPAPATRDLVGMRVLWFAPFENWPLRDHLLGRGAEMFSASDLDTAGELVLSQSINAIIADPFPKWEVFNLLPTLRAADPAAREPLPALILAHRVKPERRAQAVASDVAITDDVDEATRWLAGLRTDLRQDLPSVSLSPEERERTIADMRLLARDAQRRFDLGDLDNAEARWDSVQTLAFTIGDSDQALRARLMKARIALRKKRYALAIRRLNAALNKQAKFLDAELMTQLYGDLAEAYEGIGDERQAAEARAMIPRG